MTSETRSTQASEIRPFTQAVSPNLADRPATPVPRFSLNFQEAQKASASLAGRGVEQLSLEEREDVRKSLQEALSRSALASAFGDDDPFLSDDEEPVQIKEATGDTPPTRTRIMAASRTAKESIETEQTQLDLALSPVVEEKVDPTA